MIINFESLSEWANGDVATMKEIIHLFLENTPPTLQMLKTAIETEDWPGIARHAHKLKSSYGIVTVSNSLSLIQGIEQSAHEKQDLDRIAKDMKTLEEQFALGEKEFDTFMKENV